MRVVAFLIVGFVLSAVGAAAQSPPAPLADSSTSEPVANGSAATAETSKLDEAAALRRYIESLQKRQPNYDEMTPNLANIVRQHLPTILSLIRSWGPLQSINLKSQPGPNGMDTFEVTFEYSKVEWYIAPLTAEGKVKGLSYKLETDQGASDAVTQPHLYDEGIGSGPTKAQDIDSDIEAMAIKTQDNIFAVEKMTLRRELGGPEINPATVNAMRTQAPLQLPPRFVYSVAAFPSDASEYVHVGKRGLIFLAAFSRHPEELPLKRVYMRIAGKDIDLTPIASVRKTVPPGATRQVYGEYREDSIYLVPIQSMVSVTPLLVDFAANRNGFPISNMAFVTPDFVVNDPDRTSIAAPSPQAVKDFIASALPDFGAVSSLPASRELAVPRAMIQLPVSSDDPLMAESLQRDRDSNICHIPTDQHSIGTSDGNFVNVDSAFLATFTKCMSEKGWNLRLDTPVAQWVSQSDDTLGAHNLGAECKFTYNGQVRDALVVPALANKQASMVLGNGAIIKFDVGDYKLDTPDMRRQQGWVVLSFYPKEDFASGPDLLMSIDPCTGKVIRAELHYDG